MANRRTFLEGILGFITGLFVSKSTDAVETSVDQEYCYLALDLDNTTTRDQRENEESQFKEALDKVVDNIHTAQKRGKSSRGWTNAIQLAIAENKGLMRYYGLTIDNIRGLTDDQRSLLLDELDRAIEGSTFDYDELSISDPDIEMIEFVKHCRTLKDTHKRPRDLSDYAGPSRLYIPIIDPRTDRAVHPRDTWWSTISERKQTDES